MRNWLMLSLILALFLSCSCRRIDSNISKDSDSNLIKISAVDLYKSVAADKAGALQKYKNKSIEVSGKIFHGGAYGYGVYGKTSGVIIGENARGVYDVSTAFGKDTISIPCRFDNLTGNQFMAGGSEGLEIVLTCTDIDIEADDHASRPRITLLHCSIKPVKR